MATGAIALAAPDTAPRARMERLLPLVLVIGVLLAAILIITPWPVGAYEDDAIYTLLAKALATGEGYRMINLPGEPHATHYPPGYPLVLSLLWRAWPEFPENVVLFKFANAVFLAISAWGMFWFGRRRLQLGAVGAAVIAAVGTASVMTLHLAGLVLSEPLFLALFFLSLPLVERCADEGRMRDAIGAGAMLGALSMVRTLGAVAIGAALLVLLLRRRIRPAISLTAAAALFIVPWQLWVGAYQNEIAPVLTGKYGAYWPWMMDGYREGGVPFARAVVIENLAGMGNSLSYALMPVSYRWPRIFSLVALVPLLAVGLAALWKRAPVLVLFFVAYVGVIVVWPFHPHRFLIALWPALVVVVAESVRIVWRWAPRRFLSRGLRLGACAAAAYLVIGHAAYNWRGYADQSWVDLQRQAGESAKPLVEWVARYTQPEDVLSTEHDVVVYLYTGRRGVPTSTFLARQRVNPFTPEEVVRWVETVLTTYQPRLFITGWSAHLRAADTLAARTPPVLRRLGAIPGHVVYEHAVP